MDIQKVKVAMDPMPAEKLVIHRNRRDALPPARRLASLRAFHPTCYPARMANPSITLRKAAAQDFDALPAVDPLLLTSAARAAEVRRLLGLGDSWVAELDGAVVGYVLVSGHFFSKPFVDLLVVSESHRRRGIGSALMNRCEAVHDNDRIFTSTNRSNAPMRALLAQIGFEESGVIDNLDPGDPELVFVKLRRAG
jgi:GNAT superfamily N-acetyltransferase